MLNLSCLLFLCSQFIAITVSNSKQQQHQPLFTLFLFHICCINLKHLLACNDAFAVQLLRLHLCFCQASVLLMASATHRTSKMVAIKSRGSSLVTYIITLIDLLIQVTAFIVQIMSVRARPPHLQTTLHTTCRISCRIATKANETQNYHLTFNRT